MNTDQHLPRSLTGLRETGSLGVKVLHFLYFLLGLMLSFGALYTILKMISYIGMQLPIYTFVILSAYIAVQGVMGYGLLYMRKWLVPIAAIQFAADLIALIVLQGTILTIDLSTAMQMSGSTLLLVLFYFSRDHLVGSYKSVLPIALYTVGFIIAGIFSLSYLYGISTFDNLI